MYGELLGAAWIEPRSSAMSWGDGLRSRGRNCDGPLYAFSVQNLAASRPGPEKSLLWWRHAFYRMSWRQWRVSWQKLADRIPASYEKGPRGVLGRLKEAQCDPDVALRLAFLVASEKPASRSKLVAQNARQQSIKRKLSQARDHLQKAVFGLMDAALPELANDKKTTSRQAKCRNYVRKAAGRFEVVLSDLPLIFIKAQDVAYLRGSAETANPQDAALWMRLQDLASMCDHEIEALLWPQTVEPAAGHELFTLVSYVTACSGAPNFSLVADLLIVARDAYDEVRPAADAIESLTQDAIEKRVQRFRNLDSIQPELIEESTASRAKSGELKRELLSCYPDQAPA